MKNKNDFRFYKHFSFYHGGNNYIVTTAAAFEKMIHKYNIDFINSDFLEVYGVNLNKKTYQGKKENIRQFAIAYQSMTAAESLSWSEVASWEAFFQYAGRKYGLLKEFKTNCIC